MECQNAAEFVRLLRGCVPQLQTLPSITEVDEALQTFASNFCAGMSVCVSVCLLLASICL